MVGCTVSTRLFVKPNNDLFSIFCKVGFYFNFKKYIITLWKWLVPRNGAVDERETLGLSYLIVHSSFIRSSVHPSITLLRFWRISGQTAHFLLISNLMDHTDRQAIDRIEGSTEQAHWNNNPPPPQPTTHPPPLHLHNYYPFWIVQFSISDISYKLTINTLSIYYDYFH